MRKFLLILLFLPVALTAVAVDWTLVWEDNFDGPKIDSTVWKRIPRGGSDWENTLSSADYLYDLRDGNMILRGMVNTREKQDTSRYLTGGVWTRGTISFVPPCRVEVRARLHGAKGAWPAIWLLPFDVKKYPHPAGGEIDIMEHLSYDKEVWHTAHSYYTIKLGQGQNPPQNTSAPIDLDAFNTYAVEILPDSLCFYINDKKTFTYPRIETNLPQQYPFMVPMALLIDMQLGGGWVGEVDPRDLPVEMELDRVAYYRPATGPFFQPAIKRNQLTKPAKKKSNK